MDGEELYRDPPLHPPAHPAEIGAAALDRLRAIPARAWHGTSPATFARFAGLLLTQPRAARPAQRLGPAAVRTRLSAGASLEQAPGSRWAFVRHSGGSLQLFADGQSFPVAAPLARAAAALADQRSIPAREVRPLAARPGFADLVSALLHAGALRLSGPDAPRGRSPNAPGRSRPPA